MDGDYLIIGIVAIAVILFLLWALLQVNKARRSKKGPKVDVADIVSHPEDDKKYKKPKTVIKKRNLEKDFNRSTQEQKEEKKESVPAGGGKIEQVFTEPIKKEEPVVVPNKETNKKSSYNDKDDFERELDELIAELERETAGKSSPAPVSSKQPLDYKPYDDFDLERLNLFGDDQSYYDKNLDLQSNAKKDIEDIPVKDFLDDENYFNFTDSSEPDESVDGVLKDNSVNIIEEDYKYKRPEIDPNAPAFDRTPFNERREKLLETKSKNNSNIVVVNNSNNSRQKAKNSRNKWL